MTCALKTTNLSRNFGDVAALAGVSFELEPGLCVVTGPNGAGKTTLLRLLAGLLSPSSGSIYLDGIDTRGEPMRSRKHISYLSDSTPLYQDLSVDEHLTYRGRLKGLSGRRLRARMRHVKNSFDLQNLAHIRTAQLSAGQKKLVGLADALLMETRLLLIDEPFSDVDDAHAMRMLDEFMSIAKRTVIMLATHRFDIVSRLVGNCLVLSRGQLAGLIPTSDDTPLAERVAQCVARLDIAEEPQ